MTVKDNVICLDGRRRKRRDAQANVIRITPRCGTCQRFIFGGGVWHPLHGDFCSPRCHLAFVNNSDPA